MYQPNLKPGRRDVVAIAFIGLFAAALLPMLGACQGEQASVKHIGVVLFSEARRPQVEGFIDGLRELGYGTPDTARFTVLNASNRRSALPALVDRLVAEKVDLLALAGGLEADAAIAAVKGRHSIPVVVLYINAIVERNMVENRRDPGWPVTGIDNLNAELSGKRVSLLVDLVPRARRILILSDDNIPPSRIGVERAREAGAKLGVTIDVRKVATREDMRRVMSSLNPGEVDAMLMVPNAPIDAALVDVILPHVRRLKLPLMTFSRPMAEAGALASYGAHFYDMGYQASRLAARILEGIPPQNMPFETPKRFAYAVNRDVLRELKMELTPVARSQVNEFVETKL